MSVYPGHSHVISDFQKDSTVCNQAPAPTRHSHPHTSGLIHHPIRSMNVILLCLLQLPCFVKGTGMLSRDAKTIFAEIQ